MAEEKPNLLFLFADQLQAFALGCMGHPVVRTPHLDALAADGVLFRNTYANSPVCTPFRGILMSGQYPTQTGCFRNEHGVPEDHRCFAHVLNGHGHTTSYVGKWHLYATGNVPVSENQRCGFQRFAGYQAFNAFWDQVIFYDEQERPIEYEMHRTDATADLAARRLREIAKDGPWAHFVSFQNPHYPLQPHPAYEAMYMQAPVHFRPNVQPCGPHTPTMSPYSPRPKERDPVFQRYGRSLEAFHRLYYAMVSQLDAAVGRILRELKRLGQYEHTVIVFTSDHGEMAGSHGRMNKGLAYEESARIPLIVRTPQGLRHHVREELVSGIDLNPTMLDWLNLPAEPHFAGQSFAALSENERREAEERTIVCEFGDWLMARGGNWKLVVEREDGTPRELFDLEADPHETTNRVGAEEPRCVQARETLAAELEKWWKQVT
jgi:arylsulfatase A-like enzyme